MSTTSSADFIKDNPSPFLYGLFSYVVHFLFKRNFSRILLKNHHTLAPDSSYLFLMNHFMWWDGILPMFLHTKLFPQLNAKGIMDEEQLLKLRYFTRFRVFSVNRTQPRKAIASLNYAKEHLSQKGNALFLFPQGAIYPNDIQFLHIESGYSRIIKGVNDVKLIPIISYTESMYSKKPQLWIRFGDELPLNASPDDIKTVFSNQLHQLKNDALNRSTDYVSFP